LQQVLPAWQSAYEQREPSELTRAGKPRQRRAGGGAKGVLQSFEDKRLCILSYQQPHPWQTMHTLPFGLRQSPAHSWMHPLLPVLPEALAALRCAPERDASRLATSPLRCEGAPAGGMDGTERRRQRPTDAQRHKEPDSGNKKPHTAKHILLVNARTSPVVDLRPPVAGTTHAKKAADTAEMPYPSNAPLDKDTGLQGYEPERVLTTQPPKSPKAKR
jgi:hypothetical protein